MSSFGIALAAMLMFKGVCLADDLDTRTRLQRARVCFEALDFARAEQELAKIRPGAASMERDLRVQAMRLSAETALSTGRKADAASHLSALLEDQPDFAPLPGAWPPAWVEELERARAASPDRSPPLVSGEVPSGARAGGRLSVTVSVTDRSGIGEVVLVVAGPAPSRIPMSTEDGRTWSAAIPPDRVVEPEVRFRVEAWDLPRNGPGRWGSADVPLRVPVAPAPVLPKTPVWGRWWFWTAIGAAVAAGTGTGMYFLTRSGASRTPSRTGNVNVEVRWPYR